MCKENGNGRKRYRRDTEMLLDTDRDKNIDLISVKVSICCRTHIAVGHKIQGGSPGQTVKTRERDFIVYPLRFVLHSYHFSLISIVLVH